MFKRRIRCLLLALLCALPMLTPALAGEAADVTAAGKPLLQVHQITIGCADAYLIVYGGVSIVIDGGLNDSTMPGIVMDYLEKAGVRPLTAYFASHYHLDHVGNTNEILARFADENTMVYGPSDEVPAVLQPLAAGQFRRFSDCDRVTYGDLSITCVGPDETAFEGTVNKDSLNLLVQLGRRRFLFTGDYVRAKPLIENHRAEIEGVDVLKFPHHGIKNFCIDAWALKIVHPANIMVPGANTWEIRKYCRKIGFIPEIYDNSNGSFVFVTDGGDLFDICTHVEPGQFTARKKQ